MNTFKTGRSNTGQPQKQCRLPKAGLAAQLVTPSQLCQVEQGLVPTLCLILQRKHTTGGKSNQMLTWSVNSPLKTGRNQRWDENQFLKNLNTTGEDWGRIYWLYIYQPLRLKEKRKIKLQESVFFPYQILIVTCPKIWHKAVLSQSPLIDQLNASGITCFHLKINVSLIFRQLWCFSTQL